MNLKLRNSWIESLVNLFILIFYAFAVFFAISLYYFHKNYQGMRLVSTYK